MTTTDTILIPQTEEDIVEIKWVKPADWLATQPKLYNSIRDVLQAAGV
jgi:hypothetical protein